MNDYYGGSWIYFAKFCRSNYCYLARHNHSYNYGSFRLMLVRVNKDGR